jgi:hypothetical protein
MYYMYIYKAVLHLYAPLCTTGRHLLLQRTSMYLYKAIWAYELM